MTLTFLTSTVVAVLGYLRFKDRLTVEPDVKQQELEARIAKLEKKLNKKHKH